MPNLKRTLADFKVSVDEIKSSFIALADKKEHLEDLKLIFNVAISDLSLFPNINMPDTESYEGYLSRWIKGYEDAMNNPPSERSASPKSSCSDPAIKTIVQYATGVDEKTSDEQSNHHNLFMSAENIQGNLLEEFINKEIRKFGWIWCNGNVLRAVDFCFYDGSILLQIKNKSNTENSSSSAIRTGTTIKKWYRLGTRTSGGVKIPDYKWDNLNTIINAHSTIPSEKCNLSEEAYQAFLKDVATRNKKIITDK